MLSSNPAEQALAQGYVLGAADAWNRLKDPYTGLEFCVPVGATGTQIYEAVKTYIGAHYISEVMRRFPSNLAVQTALDRSFPCPADRKK